jgi:hypothetical protein
VRIFGLKSRTRRTLGSHQIWVFHHWSEQLVGWEARRELEEALAHVLGVEASLEATLTIAKHRPSRLTIVGLRYHSPPIKVSINMFPSSLWSRRSKLQRLMKSAAEIRSRDTDSLGSIWAIDPEANGRRLTKSVDPWANAGGPAPWCRGHILWIFLKENNSINLENRWNLRILQKHP